MFVNFYGFQNLLDPLQEIAARSRSAGAEMPLNIHISILAAASPCCPEVRPT